MPQPRNPAPAPDTAGGADTTNETTGLYTVVGVGACYAVSGDPTRIALGLQGRVIELVESEAHRLLLLAAVRAATDEDIAREEQIAARDAALLVTAALGPPDNPYGGQTVAGKTLEDHAAEQIALATKKS